MSAKKGQKSDTTPAKYCSSRCRSQKPGPQDRRIENAFIALLDDEHTFNGEEIPESITSKIVKTKGKGDSRLLVPCSAVETLVFGSRLDPSKTFGRKKNRAPRSIANESGEWKSVDMVSDDDHPVQSDDELVEFTTVGFAGKVRPPQYMTDINGGVGGEKGWAERGDETVEAANSRKKGLKIAEEREMVKRAARRGCVFGFVQESKDGLAKTQTTSDRGSAARKCEAVVNGSVVEPSFAKGDWGIRWRE